MSIKALSEYTSYAKYAKYIPEKKRRETWKEQVDRVFDMHYRKYKNQIDTNGKLKEYFDFAKEAVVNKKVLGAQRALQFGGPAIERHNEKLYNCSVTYIDRSRVFQEIMFLLLCGCGVGFSVQSTHTKNLPSIKTRSKGTKTFIIPDSIEGWADAVGIAVNSFFEVSSDWPDYEGYVVDFDYSLIRPEGSPISGGFKAPGPKGLKKSIEKITELIEARLSKGETRLHNIDLYDIVMHASDAVLSGGVRRSATICLFSKDDEEMAKAKTGNWFYTNPQRGRSNNSALLVRENTTKEEFSELMNSVKSFGEPGFVWSESEDVVYNPCVEIGMMPYIINPDGNRSTGVQFCNLTEINGRKCVSKEAFLEACKASAIIGTLQAGYTSFSYLGKTTEDIVKKESLLGCSITGMMDNHQIIFNPEFQREGAEIIKQINKEVAFIIGINQAARTTCVKPAGSTSCLLGTASGIHPHHAKRYFRRVQANKLEFPLQEFNRVNPLAVEQSVWSNNGTDMVITFLCEVPQGSITKNQLSAVQLLENVKTTQQNWVEFGTNDHLCTEKHLRHNVSNTITVEQNEWDEVTDYIYNNRQWFAGISLLPASGDKDYPQAPFCTVFTSTEIVKEYGDGSVFASGVIVNALNAFENNLWKACDAVNNNWEVPNSKQINWVRQAKQFAERYFNGDVRKMTYCLKDVHNWKTWCDLKREYKEIEWADVIEDKEYTIDINTTAGAACAGGKCELI